MRIDSLVTDDPLRLLALKAYYLRAGSEHENLEYAKEQLRKSCIIMTDLGAENFVKTTVNSYAVEGNLVRLFFNQLMHHCDEIEKSLEAIDELCGRLDDSEIRLNLKGAEEIWHWINNILSHAAQIYYVFSPDLQKNKDGNREFREYRKRALRRAAGIHSDFLKDLKNLRDAYAHYDETLDHVWRSMNAESKGSADFVIDGYSRVPPNSIVIRSYDPKEKMVTYYGRKPCSLKFLDSLSYFMFMTVPHNMAMPGSIGLAVPNPEF